MAKIIIDVDNNKLSKVMNILQNLQPELIKDIILDKQNVKPVKSSLDQIEAKAMQSNQAAQTNNANKYLSASSYKKRLQKQEVLEDEFLATKSSTGKYLNPSDYKNKLKK